MPVTRRTVALLIGIGLLAGGSVSLAQHQHDTGLRKDPADCTEPVLRCASYATPAFDRQGRLWLVWAGQGRVSVARSDDGGRTFVAAAAVTRAPLELDTGPDARPQLVVDPRGRIVVGFSIFRDAKFSGQVLVSRSVDDGATFSAPAPITDDPVSQRFLALQVDPDGAIFAAWVDKRRAAAARAAGRPFNGASLAYAWSTDGGATFSPARIAHDQMCECCRLSVAASAAGRPVVLFRNIFPRAAGGGERDHAIVTFDGPSAPGAIRRVSVDRWAIDGCPHHGPSLAIDAAGGHHVAWFTGGEARQGAFYARSVDGGRTFSEPLMLTNGGHAQRPFVAAAGDRVWLAWKEFDAGRTTVVVRSSADRGSTWTPPRVVASAAGFSDHPLLLASGDRMFLSWLTRENGYQLIPIAPES
jgi:hypothetical protein